MQDASLWHTHLGHPADSIVKSILHRCNFCVKDMSSISFCSACQIAKSHRLPFVPSLSQALAPFELIHFDVWGPSPLPLLMDLDIFYCSLTILVDSHGSLL